MDHRINIVIAENEMAEREKLKSLLASEADMQVIAEARDGRECVDLVKRHRPEIVLVKEDLPVVNGLAAAEQITAEAPEVGVILILTGSEGEEVWHKMLRAGIKEFMTRPIAGDRLIQEVRKVASLQSKAARKSAAGVSPTVAEGPKSRILTVTGPRGGCGKTVVATNLAVAMANASDKVALVDLNLWGGDIAMLLDLAPRRTLGDLLPGFGGIDYDVVDSVMVKHASGPSVLAAPLTGTFDGATLSRYMVQSILEALREHYECTVVDTGYANLESTLAAMDYSDVILVVVGMDLPRLRDGKLYLKNLMAANYPKEKIRVVVNRASGSKEISPGEVESNLESTLAAMDYSDVILVVVGMDLPRLRDGKLYLKNLMAANYAKEKIRVVVNRASGSKEISPGEVESILEFPVMAQLPNDDSLVASSVNLGQPFVTTSPNKQLSRAILSLAEELAPTAAGAGAKRGRTRWFSFLQ